MPAAGEEDSPQECNFLSCEVADFARLKIEMQALQRLAVNREIEALRSAA